MIRLAVLLALGVSCAAHAQSGRELLADCRAAEASYNEERSAAPELPPQAWRCVSYVEGFADGYGIGDYLAGRIGVQLDAFCLPAGEDRRFRLIRAVVAHLEKQPPHADAASRTLVAGAFARAFPCTQ